MLHKKEDKNKIFRRRSSRRAKTAGSPSARRFAGLAGEPGLGEKPAVAKDAQLH
jgi:hypothetical protein